jgi:Rrf2 family protein
MKLNQTIAYAVAAMTYMAAQPAGSLISNTTTSRATKTPERYLLQVLRKLVLSGVLNSVRGVQGGFRLAKPANKITLLEIVEAVDGPIGQCERVDLPAMSAKASAGMLNAFRAVEGDARKRLASVTLADLLRAKAA